MNYGSDIRAAVDAVEAFGVSVILDKTDPIHCWRCGEVMRVWRDDEENLYAYCTSCTGRGR